MNHAEIKRLKSDHHELAKELRKLFKLERDLEEGMKNAKAMGDKERIEEQLIRTRANIGACLRRQDELKERVKEAWR